MKLIIQIPCHNEAPYLPATLKELPRQVPGFVKVEWLVIDDGSTDGTGEVARAAGVDHVVRLPVCGGLARAFRAGISRALELGADAIVNLDADNQYPVRHIPALVAPVLNGASDMAVGVRPLMTIEHFSMFKRTLEVAGSRVVSLLSGCRVADAASGYRAYTRETALRLCLYGRFSYTLESLFWAAANRLRVASVPITVNPPVRSSRLAKHMLHYLLRSTGDITRSLILHRPVLLSAILWGLSATGIVFFAPGGASDDVGRLFLAGCASAGLACALQALRWVRLASERALIEQRRRAMGAARP